MSKKKANLQFCNKITPCLLCVLRVLQMGPINTFLKILFKVHNIQSTHGKYRKMAFFGKITFLEIFLKVHINLTIDLARREIIDCIRFGQHLCLNAALRVCVVYLAFKIYTKHGSF